MVSLFLCSSVESVGPFWFGNLRKPGESLGETGSSPKIYRILARCKWQVPVKRAPLRLTASRRRTGSGDGHETSTPTETVKRGQAHT